MTSTPGPAPEPLRLGGVPEHFNFPWHLAMASAEVADLDLRWEDQLGGTGEMLAGLANGTLDLVSILTEGTVAAIEADLAATIIQVYVSSPLRWGVFVPGTSDLRSGDSLEGRPIAISRFQSGSHLIARIQANRFGWALDEDQFVVAGGLEGAREAFARGDAEVFLWDQYMCQPLVDSGEFRKVAIEATPWPSFVFAARNETLLARTAEIGRVVDAVVAQARALHRRPDIVEAVSTRYGLGPETVSAWLKVTSFAPREAFDPAVAEEVLTILGGGEQATQGTQVPLAPGSGPVP